MLQCGDCAMQIDRSVASGTRLHAVFAALPVLLSVRRLSDQQSYPAAGSFVSFLIDEHGMAAMLTFFRGGTREESRAAIDARFSATFGLSVAAAEVRWRNFLGTL